MSTGGGLRVEIRLDVTMEEAAKYLNPAQLDAFFLGLARVVAATKELKRPGTTQEEAKP